MSAKRLVAAVVLAACVGMLAYGLLVQSVEVYAAGEDKVVKKVGGPDLIYESVRRTIVRDSQAGRLVVSEAGPVECPT
jgi:hypothetical protein